MHGGPNPAARALQARRAASSRTLVDQAGIVSNPPSGIGDHLSQLRENAANLFEEGWRVCTVDVSRLFAVQPMTFLDHAHSNLSTVSSADMADLARVTLPLSTQVEMAMSCDPASKVWTVTSDNLNLQVLGPLEPDFDSAGFPVGFKVTVSNSLLQVAHLDGRYFCYDSHHRSYQLLRRGIREVPALVRSFSTFAELAPKKGLFPPEVLLGENPPTVLGLTDDEVSADVWLSAG